MKRFEQYLEHVPIIECQIELLYTKIYALKLSKADAQITGLILKQSREKVLRVTHDDFVAIHKPFTIILTHL